MKTHQITGVGPEATDGSRELFTVLPTPFRVHREWLLQYVALPAIGDVLVEQEDGALSLGATGEPVADVAALAAEEAQKKTDGFPVFSSGFALSPSHKYIANPVMVDAFVIVDTVTIDDVPGLSLTLDGVGAAYQASPDMLSRMTPEPGDYLVVQADGYTYLNPKNVFERKYNAMKE